MNLKKLKGARTAILIVLSFALIVAGLWIIAAYYLGAVVGAGVGLTLSGLAFLIIEGLSARPGDR